MSWEWRRSFRIPDEMSNILRGAPNPYLPAKQLGNHVRPSEEPATCLTTALGFSNPERLPAANPGTGRPG